MRPPTGAPPGGGSRRASAPLSETARAFASLDLRVRRRLGGLLHGDEAGLRLGPGSEPEEVTRYRPGEDDVRRIDWNVTARSSEPHVWRTVAEHERETWVLVDETASMDFGTTDLEKGDLATWVTGALGLLSAGPGNRLGVAHLRPEGMAWTAPLPPRTAAMQALSRLPASPGQAGSSTGRTPTDAALPSTLDLAGALDALGARHRRPGVRVVVTDFVEPDGRTERPYPWERPMRRLAQRHEVLVVEVVDPRELTLPDVGPVVLVDPETGHRCEVWTSSARLRHEYAELAAAHRAGVAAAVRAAGAGHLVLRTDRDWVDDLARHVVGRRTPQRAGRRAARSPR
ncbi:DUF58 domain-containing protein [Nocardioides aurantiacus]|uniref:Uncharacterized protein DUF58 n=1 Tax=Nocardioides aurantiacus TaxID=86796 RepID=A0A3N2CR31_9ACTN|nr:DUF58 domain-containing protein [Nocardioides aurantiacus]ROR89878.1 uncharacterized protein DUF58 [Nocardioides aurantiacus]